MKNEEPRGQDSTFVAQHLIHDAIYDVIYDMQKKKKAG